jgi:hypothetical protein
VQSNQKYGKNAAKAMQSPKKMMFTTFKKKGKSRLSTLDTSRITFCFASPSFYTEGIILIDTSPIIVIYNRICYNLKKGLTMQRHEEPTHHLTHLIREINMKLSDVLTQNTSIKAQLNKAEAEIVKRADNLQSSIDKLNQQLANVELTDEQAASFEEVKVAAQALDDLNSDIVPPEA